MVEPIMYLAIGFLISMLCGLMILPLVHNRAVRLTTRRLEAATPISMAEIQADKDQLRAKFAMSARQLEMKVEQLKDKSTSQLAELGKKSAALNRIKLEIEEKSAAIFALETREKLIIQRLRTTEDELAGKAEMLRTAEAALSQKQAELARLTDELADRSLAANTRQVELIAVRSQIDALKNRVGDAGQKFTSPDARDELAAVSSASPASDRLREEPDAEQTENALLRERINGIAAEVAMLAMTLEGPHSTIGAMLAAEPSAPTVTGDTTSRPVMRGTLADRIRALQSHSSSVREAS